jgi:hypothetical protein
MIRRGGAATKQKHEDAKNTKIHEEFEEKKRI